MILITLPFPARQLNPNANVHWKAKLRPKKLQRAAGFAAAFPFRGQLGKENIAIRLTFFSHQKVPNDLDNLLAACKPMLDGVAQGLAINDRQFRPITIDFGEPDQKNPRTELEIL